MISFDSQSLVLTLLQLDPINPTATQDEAFNQGLKIATDKQSENMAFQRIRKAQPLTFSLHPASACLNDEGFSV